MHNKHIQAPHFEYKAHNPYHGTRSNIRANGFHGNGEKSGICHLKRYN